MTTDSYTIRLWGNIAHKLVQPLKHWSSLGYWFTDILRSHHASSSRLILRYLPTSDGFGSCKLKAARIQTERVTTNLTADVVMADYTSKAMSIILSPWQWTLKCVGSFRSVKFQLKKLISIRKKPTNGHGIWNAGNCELNNGIALRKVYEANTYNQPWGWRAKQRRQFDGCKKRVGTDARRSNIC